MKLTQAVAAVVLMLAPAAAQNGPKYFTPDTGTAAKMEEALATARGSNRRVLAIYGGTWCTSCADFTKLTQADPSLLKAYVPMHVHTSEAAPLQPLAQRLRTEVKPEIGPFLAIVDQDGTELQTAIFGRISDPAKLKAFLERWELGGSAEQIMAKALPALGGKLGWVEFRADWCTWCKRLEKFFASSDAAPILAKYYSVITVDYEKNTGAPALANRLGAKGNPGLPWFAVVDAKGASLGNSDGPKGNVGFPNNDEERAHMVSVIRSTAKGITPDEVETVAKALKAAEVPPATPARKQ
jgi:thiol:disulfide interchange protein